MPTFGQVKTAIRAITFVTGEAPNVVALHDKMFVDAMADLQKVVECLRQDNTSIIPHCAELYNCGLSVTDAPRGLIKHLSVVDRINKTTGKEDAAADLDWCSAVDYTQVSPCHIHDFFARSRQLGCCLNIPLFFGLPGLLCGKANYPTPTDEGLPSGLAPLPLGFHYPQTSTDRPHGRAKAGVWAIERGKIYIAPWIQSTESIMLVWDGYKNSWTDADPIDDDPLLSEALEEYVRWKHAGKIDKDEAEAARAAAAYAFAKQKLLENCIEENRVRECEPSYARSSSTGVATLYYNETQRVSVDCPKGQTGDSQAATVAAGTVASVLSVADANQKAKDQATAAAKAKLSCVAETVTYWNDQEAIAHASCVGEALAPTPEGAEVTVIIGIHKVSSTDSVAVANANAQAQAQQDANAKLSCTYFNREQTVQWVCQTNPAIMGSETIPAKTAPYSASTQNAADALALAAAQNLADAALAASACGATLYWNTEQIITATGDFVVGVAPNIRACHIRLWGTVLAHTFSDTTDLAHANTRARNAGNAWLIGIGQYYQAIDAAAGVCQYNNGFHFTYPNTGELNGPDWTGTLWPGGPPL
jgi:hypothetical protein